MHRLLHKRTDIRFILHPLLIRLIHLLMSEIRIRPWEPVPFLPRGHLPLSILTCQDLPSQRQWVVLYQQSIGCKVVLIRVHHNNRQAGVFPVRYLL